MTKRALCARHHRPKVSVESLPHLSRHPGPQSDHPPQMGGGCFHRAQMARRFHSPLARADAALCARDRTMSVCARLHRGQHALPEPRQLFASFPLRSFGTALPLPLHLLVAPFSSPVALPPRASRANRARAAHAARCPWRRRRARRTSGSGDRNGVVLCCFPPQSRRPMRKHTFRARGRKATR